MSSSLDPAAPSKIALITPWYYGWNVLAVSILAVAMSTGMVFSSFTFFIMDWMDEFGIDRAEGMLTLAITQLLSGVLNPFSGRAMDRFSIRWVGAGGLVFLAIGLFLVSLANALWQIMVIYGLFFSIAFAMAGGILGQTMAAKWFRKNRGLAIGLAAAGSSFGGFIFPPIVALMLGAFDWRFTFASMAAMVLCVGLPAFIAIARNSPEHIGVEPEPESLTRPARPSSDGHWNTKSILLDPIFWALVIGFMPMLLMTTGLVSNLGPYTQDLQISTSQAAVLMSVWSLTMIVGKMLYGSLVDHFSPRWLFLVVLVTFCLCLFLFSTQPSYFFLMAIVVLFGLSAGGQLPLIGGIIGNYFGPLAFGSVFGLFNFCIRPVAIAAPLAGFIRDSQGSYASFWLGGLAVVFVTGTLSFRLLGKADGINDKTP